MDASTAQALQALLSRHSVGPKHLVEPAPDDAQLAQMVAAALRAPDHGELAPLRFVLVRGAARARMAQLFAHRKRGKNRRDPKMKA